MNLDVFAKNIGCDHALLQAICNLETKGSGFLEDGRPKILFEGHVFSRLTGGIFDKIKPNISYPKWDRSKYATGATAEIRGIKEHERLAEAAELNRDAALQSASWGKFQIMGFNFSACGFKSVQDFVNAMYAGNDSQTIAFCNFIKSNRELLQAMQRKDFASIAKHYNGAGFAANKYDQKLRKEYEKIISTHT